MPEEKQEITKPLRRVRVVNDGQPGYATRITDAETGQFIDHIYHVKVVDIDVHDTPRILLWAHMPAIDVVGDAEIINVCPYCKTRKSDEDTKDSAGKAWKIKLDIDDTDVVYSIQRLQDLRREYNDLARQSIGPAEAITAFMRWLTTRKEVSGEEAMKLVEKFCRIQGWNIKNKKYTELIKEVWEDGSIAIINNEENIEE